MKLALAAVASFVSLSAFAATPLFDATRLPVSAAGTQVRVAIGDADNDGRNDLVVVNAVPGSPLRIYSIASNGDATLKYSVPLAPAPDGEWTYAPPRIIDVDGDGDRDIALYLRADGMHGILQFVRWTGAGFVASQPYITPESDAAYGFDMADFDGDGIADVLTADHGLNAPQAIHIAGGATFFSTSRSYPFPFNGIAGTYGETQRGIIYPYARDLNGDGHIDVAVSTAPWNGVAARIFWNDGRGNLAVAQNVGTAPSIDLGIGDQNNDGSIDLVANGNRVSDLRAYRGPQFTSSSLFRIPPDPRTPLIADFTGDGKPDVAVAVTSSKSVIIVGSGGAGQLVIDSPDLAAADFMPGAYVQELTSGDLDNDGRLDLLFATDRIIWIRRSGAPLDTTPPTLTLPADRVVDATSAAGAIVTWTASATDAVDGAVNVTCSAASGSLFALGTTTVTCTARDAAGNIASGSFNVTVRDTTAPTIVSLSATPNVLRPPNHKMVAVAITVVATDAVDAAPSARITRVVSDEAEDGLGDGDTGPDWAITGPLSLLLRAERGGTGDGRTYTIFVEATDRSGNSSSGSVTVTVPR